MVETETPSSDVGDGGKSPIGREIFSFGDALLSSSGLLRFLPSFVDDGGLSSCGPETVDNWISSCVILVGWTKLLILKFNLSKTYVKRKFGNYVSPSSL